MKILPFSPTIPYTASYRYESFLHSEICITRFPCFQAEKEKGELEVELEHLKSAGNKSLPSVSKVRLSEMRLKREVTQLKQQLTLVFCNSFQMCDF